MKNSIVVVLLVLSSFTGYSQKDENLIFTFKKHSQPVLGLSFSRDGNILASGGDDKTIFLWDLKTGEPSVTISNNYFPVKVLKLIDENRILAASGTDVKMIDYQGKILKAYKGYTTHIWSFDYNEKGNILTAGSYSNKILVWDFISGDIKIALEGHEKSVLPVAFSPDGLFVASGSLDRSVRIWDAITGNELKNMKIHSDNILAVKFHPSGKYVASASLDKTVRLWDVETGKLIKTYAGHDKAVFDIDFSADGFYLASGSQDNTVVLWDVFTGNKIYSFIDNENAINVVKFSPDGKFLAAGSSDNTVNVWKLNSKIFVSLNFQDKVDEEIAGSDLFGPKRKDENKQEYEEREKMANAKLDELYDKYYNEYLKTRKNSFE